MYVKPKKKKYKLYIRVTADKYQLPVAIAETPKELAESQGVTLNAVYSGISKNRIGKHKSTYERVVYTEEEWNADL